MQPFLSDNSFISYGNKIILTGDNRTSSQPQDVADVFKYFEGSD